MNPELILTEKEREEVEASLALMRKAADAAARLFPKEKSWAFYFELAQCRVHGDIVSAMKTQGVTQAELARRLGVSRAWVSRVLSDPDENYQLETIAKIAHALGREVRIELVPREGAKQAEAPVGGKHGGAKKPAKTRPPARPAGKIAAKPAAKIEAKPVAKPVARGPSKAAVKSSRKPAAKAAPSRRATSAKKNEAKGPSSRRPRHNAS